MLKVQQVLGITYMIMAIILGYLRDVVWAVVQFSQLK